MKAVISNKEGKDKQVELDETQSASLNGAKIGDKISGDSIGLEGYELEIKGGTDDAGFPMRRDVQGTLRKRILATSGTGLHIDRKGMRKRKSVRGNTISDVIAQVNLYIIKQGSEDLFTEPKPEAPAEAEEKTE